MDFVIHSVGMPFNRDTVKEQGLGGSESAAYYKAMELARRGHRVKLFTSHEKSEPDYIDGVQFISAGQYTQQTPLGDRFEHYARNTQHDVLIIQRFAPAFHAPFAAKVCVHEHHDLALGRFAAQVMAGAWQVGAFTAVSQWHKKQIEEVYGLNPDSVKVVPNGVDGSLYVAAAGAEDPYAALPDYKPGQVRLVYQSRPERGLDHLLRPGGIMDRLKDILPDAVLYVFGYDNTVPQMAAYYDQLKAYAAALPNVRWVGAVSKAKLAEYQTFADAMVYPTEFEEVSCITAMEAMCASLPLLASECAALPETCKDSGTALIPLRDGQANEDLFVLRLQAWFTEGSVETKEVDELRAKQSVAATNVTWERSVDALLEHVGALFQASTAAVLRTAVERSDIRFAQQVLEQLTQQEIDSNAVISNTRDELKSMYSFLDSDEAYSAHYAKHQSRYYDDHDVVGEDVTRTTRFKGVHLLFADIFQKREGEKLRVLDYGCAHGHYTVPLAKAFPQGEFVGLDVSRRAVETFNKWIDRDGVPNARAWQDTDPAHGISGGAAKFDIILAGEVLEHVRDPYALLERFRESLTLDGVLILTTPVGRWEHSGIVEFRKAREHVEHFERADLDDIFAGHTIKVLSAPAGKDRSGFNLGSYVIAVQFNDGSPIGRPDFQRKLNSYRPRETISACLIVKDSETTLQRCIESIVDWVDEICVAFDAKSSDGSKRLLADLQMKYPQRVFKGTESALSATVDGFDALRNESIAMAQCDWVLWIDADEEMRNPWNLHKLARPSMHNAYGFRQIHYSSEPAQVISTDMPCRFFRNGRGVKFYGLVHEHPETEIGKGIPFSIVRPECDFLHAGYVDEETRRARFRRNYPLVLRDRKENPGRKLNMFLSMRDIAQSIVFEREQMGGGTAQHHLQSAQAGVELFTEMLRSRGGHIGNRMLIDCLPYYSACVETLGAGFDASFSFKHNNGVAPDLATSGEASGRFHSREFHREFINAILEEATAKYESKYL